MPACLFVCLFVWRCRSDESAAEGRAVLERWNTATLWLERGALIKLSMFSLSEKPRRMFTLSASEDTRPCFDRIQELNETVVPFKQNGFIAWWSIFAKITVAFVFSGSVKSWKICTTISILGIIAGCRRWTVKKLCKTMQKSCSQTAQKKKTCFGKISSLNAGAGQENQISCWVKGSVFGHFSHCDQGAAVAPQAPDWQRPETSTQAAKWVTCSSAERSADGADLKRGCST